MSSQPRVEIEMKISSKKLRNPMFINQDVASPFHLRVNSAGVANAIRMGKSARKCVKRGREGGPTPSCIITRLSGGDATQPNRYLHSKQSNVDQTASSDVEVVTEVAHVWSVIGFLITTAYTGMHAYFASNGDRTITKFYTVIILPLGVTTLALSFALKPRRTDFAYRTFLTLQYFLFSIGSETLAMCGYGWRIEDSLDFFIRCPFWLAISPLLWFMRQKIAELEDDKLSDFLSMNVVKGGLLVGLGQLAFLMFSSVQCENEARMNGRDWRDCKRSLFSQSGLGGMISLFTIIKLLSGIVPKKYIEKHIVTIEMFMSMKLR